MLGLIDGIRFDGQIDGVRFEGSDSFLPVQCSGTQAIISGVSITRVRDWPSRLFSRMYVHLYLVRVNTFYLPYINYNYNLPLSYYSHYRVE